MLVTPTMTETVSGIFIDLADPKPEDIKISDIAWALSRQARYAGHTMSTRPYTVAQHTVMVSRYVEEALTPSTHLHEVFTKYVFQHAENFARDADTADNVEFCKWMTYEEQHREVSVDLVKMHALHGLMHDFAEAYLVDLPTPVKCLPGVREAYKKAEEKMDFVIMKTLGLTYVDKFPGTREFGNVVVKWADMYALMIEAYHFMPSRGLNWNLTLERPSLDMLHKFRWPIEPVQAYEELLARYEELKPIDTQIFDGPNS